MESQMYREVFSKWLEQGRAEGEVRAQAETIIQILTHRLGKVSQKVRDHVRSLTDDDTRRAWYNEALLATTAEDARRLMDKIRLTID